MQVVASLLKDPHIQFDLSDQVMRNAFVTLDIPMSYGAGQIEGIHGNVDICIPIGGTAADALLFVPDYYTHDVKVFTANNGTLVCT